MSAGSVNYRNGIRSAVRSLWLSASDYYQFADTMDVVVHHGLTLAYHEGAKACGILPAELSPTERAELRQAIASEVSHIDAFATVIEAGSKANGGKLAPLFAKAETWILRYKDVVNQAKVSTCGDQKLEWVWQALGVTKNPCGTCKDKLNGKIKRASYWARVGVRPQNPPNPYLECEGWGCLCDFRPTDAPMSKGPLPKLP